MVGGCGEVGVGVELVVGLRLSGPHSNKIIIHLIRRLFYQVAVSDDCINK